MSDSGSYDNSTEENMEESPQNSCAYTFLNESPIVIDDDDSLSDINNSGIIHGSYDNSTEENMEESPQNSCTYTFLNESPIVIDDDDSLSDINNSGIIHGSYDNSTEENIEESPQNSCTYTFLNESPIVVDDDDSLSDINNSGIIHGSYDNSTEENMEESPQNSCAYTFLNESPIVIDDDDSLSDINNGGIIHGSYDNSTEENMEESPQNSCAYTFLNESPIVIDDDDSLSDINNSGIIHGSYDNSTEENIEESPQNSCTYTFLNESPIVVDDDDSLSDINNSGIIHGSYDNSTEENMEESPQNSCAYTFLNESPIVIDDDDSLSDINNGGIIHGSYDNSTEENMEEFPQNSSAYTFLNESPIIIDDDDSLSDINNSGIIHVRNNLNMPIPNHQITVSNNSEDNSDSGIELIEPLMRSKKNIMDGATKNSNLFIRQKENNSLNINIFIIASTDIPNKPIYIRSKEILARCSMLKSNASLSHRLKSTVKKKQMSSSPKFVQLSTSSKSLKQSDSLPLSHNTSETHRLQNSKITRVVKKPSNKYKASLFDKINYLAPQNDSSDKDDTSKKFISCNYENCGTLVEEPELLIDGLYCSLSCKNNKQTVIKEEHFIDKAFIPTKKTTVDRNHILTKLENRINKTKQLIHFFNESSKEENQPPLKSLLPISSPEAIDDDDNDYDADDYFDLKPLIKDKDVLKYMKKLQHKSAPVKLFDRPFPTEKNLFVVGEKLEGIDPKDEALFCVLTISEKIGYRIKLHFDGFEDKYDFWVNADCPDLFHPGWCKLNSRILQPPCNYRNVFNWTDYLKKYQASPAPKRNFFSTKSLNSCTNPHKFQIGGKLEALDKMSRTSIKCIYYVATVADILGNRIRIHFDGYEDCYDYWADITSTYIHPVGWCEKNGRTLYPYCSYDDKKGKKPFNWTKYLADKKSKPVPEDAFVGRPIREFSKKMIIEVVDLVVPRLLRIAKVLDVRGAELKIVYDGFDDKYAYWVEDDSPDIHPVGWSLKTNHPIEVPPASDTFWSCNIRGCKGYGNSSNGSKINHVKRKDCPYNMVAWKRAVKLLVNMPYRLKTRDVVTKTTLKRSKIKSNVHKDDEKKKKPE